MIPVPRELLEQLAREVPSEQKRKSNGQPGWTSTSPDNVQAVRSVLTNHGAEIVAEAPYKDSWRLLLSCCPFDSSHKDAAVFVPASGRTGFHCFHESCKGKKWREVLLLWRVEEQSRPIDPEPVSERGNHSRYNWPDPLAEDAYHGVVGQIVKAIEPHSEADPTALLLQLLVGCGNIIGRKPFFVTEETLQYMSLYVVLVGQTAKARKGTSWGRTRGTLLDVDMEWADRRILGGLSSGEGVIWNVRDPMKEMSAVREKGRVVRYESVDSDPGETDKRLMVFEAEFARVLQSCERDTNTLSSVLRQAWDGEPLGILTKKNGARSTEPHISIIAHITKDELRRLLTDTAKTSGFANRFLWICTRRSKELPEDGEKVDFGDMKERLKKALERAAKITEVKRNDEARAVWRAVYHDLSEGRPGLLGSITSRADTQVVRLSTLYALLDGEAVIRAEHIMAALAVWKYAEDSARFIFGDAMGDPTADEILRQLRYHPEGMTRTEIRDYFQRNKSSAEVDRALGVLQEYGLARMVREQQEVGRPTELWYANTASPSTT